MKLDTVYVMEVNTYHYGQSLETVEDLVDHEGEYLIYSELPTLYSPFSALYSLVCTPSSARFPLLSTLCCMLHTPPTVLYAMCFALYTLDSLCHTLYSRVYDTLHSTLYSL